MMPFRSASDALAAACRPAGPVRIGAPDGLHRIIADAVHAQGAVPGAPMALVEGWAVAAHETLGASPYAPAPAGSVTVRVPRLRILSPQSLAARLAGRGADFMIAAGCRGMRDAVLAAAAKSGTVVFDGLALRPGDALCGAVPARESPQPPLPVLFVPGPMVPGPMACGLAAFPVAGCAVPAHDARFAGRSAAQAAALDPDCLMANCNQGAGTRIMIDRLLGRHRPKAYWNQHNAAAAAVARRRADRGVAIEPVARAYGLTFVPLGQEHYDCPIATSRLAGRAVQAFVGARGRAGVDRALREAGLSRDGLAAEPGGAEGAR